MQYNMSFCWLSCNLKCKLQVMADLGARGNVAEKPTAGMAVYSASKAALTALDAALAREFRARKVDVIDLRPPHTETGLADRPIAGQAPRLPAGRRPDVVAERIVRAIECRERVVAANEF